MARLPEVQLAATELLQILHEIRNRHDQDAAEARELQWEHDTLVLGVAV